MATSITFPILLYSFRRCPAAIRARLALRAAGFEPGSSLELREVNLRAKPPELLEVSPRGTVPALLADGQALDESLAIMNWALERSDPRGWLSGWSASDRAVASELIAANEGPFRHHLDRYRYPERFAVEAVEREQHRQQGLAILGGWSQRLEAGGWLLGERSSLADWALLPFVRQFRHTEATRFDGEPGLAPLQAWLSRFLAGEELAAVMDTPWAERCTWRSPRRLYHLALRGEWQEARRSGVYERSTRGQSLQEVGFVHLSYAHQVADTHARFYGDLPPDSVLLLSLDPQRLEAAGLTVRAEPAPGTGELFPHLYGPLPLAAVLLAEIFR